MRSTRAKRVRSPRSGVRSLESEARRLATGAAASPAAELSPPPPKSAFRPKEWALIARLRTPKTLQAFLRDLPYNWEIGGETLRTLRGVVRTGQAHCLEAALAAATILEQHGYPPLLLDLESQDNTDHVLFLFRHRGRWGTVARSRDAGLHGRKPVFRTLRQLVDNYADPYVDFTGRITGYGVFDLRTLRRCDWRLSERNVWAVQTALIRMPHLQYHMPEKRYRRMKHLFLEFKAKYPDRPVDFYKTRPLWL